MKANRIATPGSGAEKLCREVFGEPDDSRETPERLYVILDVCRAAADPRVMQQILDEEAERVIHWRDYPPDVMDREPDAFSEVFLALAAVIDQHFHTLLQEQCHNHLIGESSQGSLERVFSMVTDGIADLFADVKSPDLDDLAAEKQTPSGEGPPGT